MAEDDGPPTEVDVDTPPLDEPVALADSSFLSLNC